MRIKEAVAPIAAAVVLLTTGCSNEENSAKSDRVPRTEPTQPMPYLSPYEKWRVAMQESLNRFRNEVLTNHQAKIVLGACVAWENDTGGTTVTLNPGIGEFSSDTEKYDYLIFSAHNPKYNPDWGPLNGPEIGSESVITLVFMPDKPVKGGLNRILSDKELETKNGQRHYTDTQTGEPVMNTALAKGPFTSEFVGDVCDALRYDEPIPTSSGTTA